MKLLSFFLLFTVAAFTANAQGSLQWQRGCGGYTAYAIQQTHDGGYVVAGWGESPRDTDNHGRTDYHVVKLSAMGATQWAGSYGGHGNDDAMAAQQTPDSGYIIAGWTDSASGDVTFNHGHSDYWIIKLSSTGSMQWQKSLGGSGDDLAYAVGNTLDGGYIVAGASRSADGDATVNHGQFDYWVTKLDFNGNIQWQKSLGGSGDDVAQAVQQTADGGYIVAGYTNSANGDIINNHGDDDYWVVKLSATGGIQWERTYGGSDDDRAYAIQQTKEGGYLVAGYTDSDDGDVTGNHGDSDYWILKLSPTGSPQWKKTLGGSNDDVATSVQQTADSGYIVAGATRSADGDVTGNHGNFDFWLVRLSPSGSVQWQQCAGGSNADEAYAVVQAADGSFTAAGYSYSTDDDAIGNNGGDFWVINLYVPAGIQPVQRHQSVSLSPNPTTGILRVAGVDKADVQVYNMMGQLVKEMNSVQEFSITELPLGVYIVKVTDENGALVQVEKVVKE